MRADTQQARAADPVSRWLCVCGALIPWVMAAFVIAASLANPGYSHVSETVSLLGTRERVHPEVINLGFVVLGVLTLCFARGVYRVLGRRSGARVVWLLLAACGACVVVSGLFQDDPQVPGQPGTLEGALHSAFAFGAFFALLIAMLAVAKSVHRDPAWSGFTRLSAGIAAFAFALSLCMPAEAFRPFEGLLQRFLYAALLVWVEAIAFRSYHLAAGRGGGSRVAAGVEETGHAEAPGGQPARGG